MSGKVFPTVEKFNAQAVKKKESQRALTRIMTWKELTVNEIYRIDAMRIVPDGMYGDSTVLTIATATGKILQVWATTLIVKELSGDGWNKEAMQLPCYIQPLGWKKSKKDSSRQYHDFQILTAADMD
jgi:hypothetical protein